MLNIAVEVGLILIAYLYDRHLAFKLIQQHESSFCVQDETT